MDSFAVWLKMTMNLFWQFVFLFFRFSPYGGISIFYTLNETTPNFPFIGEVVSFDLLGMPFLFQYQIVVDTGIQTFARNNSQKEFGSGSLPT